MGEYKKPFDGVRFFSENQVENGLEVSVDTVVHIHRGLQGKTELKLETDGMMIGVALEPEQALEVADRLESHARQQLSAEAL
ncbi:MAG: hypothetical protein ABEI86_08455 [Halobacteriaceae archaeon]